MSSSTLRHCWSNSILLLNSAASLYNFSWYVEFNFVALFIKLNSCAQLHQRVSSTPSASQLNSAASLLNSVSGSFHFCILTLWRVLSVGPFISHTPWRVRLFILHSVQERPLYPVLRVYATLSTLDSALLCNSEILYRVVILWLCTA